MAWPSGLQLWPLKAFGLMGLGFRVQVQGLGFGVLYGCSGLKVSGKRRQWRVRGADGVILRPIFGAASGLYISGGPS